MAKKRSSSPSKREAKRSSRRRVKKSGGGGVIWFLLLCALIAGGAYYYYGMGSVDTEEIANIVKEQVTQSEQEEVTLYFAHPKWTKLTAEKRKIDPIKDPVEKVQKLMDLLILANKLTMTVLIEVHGADTLLAVRSMIGFPQKHYSVIGINNRDLTTMTVDLATTNRLAELIDEKNQLVAESGIKTRDDVKKVITAGANAVLIGQTLCESESIESKFKELFGPGAS